jgi:DNA-binding HxlR family transcriptional regulator
MARSYQQYCPVARALEVVGERWTVLVVRELLLGPRRFTDLMAGLPGVSANVLAARLRDLEHEGLVAKRDLPPPAASTVYELTDDARGLAGVVAAMAEWGMTLLGRPRKTDEIRGEWLVLGLAVTTPAPAADAELTYEFRLDDGVLHVRAHGGHLQPLLGPATSPDAIIFMDAKTLAAVANGDLDPRSPKAEKLISTQGDSAAARRLLESFSRAPG